MFCLKKKSGNFAILWIAIPSKVGNNIQRDRKKINTKKVRKYFY